MNVRFVGDLAVLSNFGRLLNDPRHFDAVRDTRALLDQGLRKFAIDLTTLHDLGGTVLGLLTTITREIRGDDGEAVLFNVGKETARYLDEMRMDAYWDIYETLDEARLALEGQADDPEV